MRDKNMQNKMQMILGGRFDHDHVEDEDRTIEMKTLRQTCKQKAIAEPCERPNKLITRSVNRGNGASTLQNSSSWPRKSGENIRANVTPKLSANAPLLWRKCMISANEIFEK